MKAKFLHICLLTVLSSLYLNSFSADLFWVGGSGAWSDGSHWATVSGGIAGTKVPTSTDNVFIDSKSFTASGQSITISGSVSCNNLTWNATSFTPELIGKSTSQLNIFGALSLNDNYTDSYFGSIVFTGSSNNPISLSKSLHSNILFDGIGSWTFLSDVVTSQNIKLQSGTVNTNGAKVYAKSFDGNGSTTRSLTLGNSVLTVTSWLFGVTENLSFDAGKSKIIVLGSWKTELQKGNLIYNVITSSNKRAFDFTTSVTPYTCDAAGKAKGRITATITGATSSDLIGYILYKNGTALYTERYDSDPDALNPFIIDSLMLDPSFGNSYSLDIFNESSTEKIHKTIVYPGVWPSPMKVGISVIKQVTCALISCDAKLSADPTGGVAPYRYKWLFTGNQTTRVATGVCNNISLACEVTDTNSCKTTGTINYYPGQIGYTGPRKFLFVADPVASTKSCGTQNNGTISIKMQGGMGPRQFKLVSNSGTDNRTYQADSNFLNLKAGEKYAIWAKDSVGCEIKAANDITIGTLAQPAVSAGIDSLVCSNTSVSMGAAVATNCSVIAWTSSGDGTFSPTSIRNPKYTLGKIDVANGLVTLTITGTGLAGCSQVVSSRIITISPSPTVFAGPDQTVCLSTQKYKLSSASAANYSSLTWITKGTGAFSNASILQPDYTFSQPDTISKLVKVVLSAQGSGGCATVAISDTMSFTMKNPPYVYAGTDQNICKGNTFTASTASEKFWKSLLWTTDGTGVFVKDTSMRPIYTPSNADQSKGSVKLTVKATAYSPCADSSKTITLSFTDHPTISAGNDTSVCSNGPFTLTKPTKTNCTLQWFTSGDGTFNDNTLINPIYNPGSGDNTKGSVTLTVTGIGSGGCTSLTVTDNMVLTLVDSAVVSIVSPLRNICKGSVLSINDATVQNNGLLQWTSTGTGTFSAPKSTITNYTPSNADNGLPAPASVSLTLTAKGTGPCPDVSSQITLNLKEQPSLSAGGDVTVCSKSPYLISKSSELNTSTRLWNSKGDGTFSLASALSLHPTYNPGPNDQLKGSVKLYLTVWGTSSCATTVKTDTMKLTMNDPPAVYAGSDIVVCKNKPISVSDATASKYASLKWTSSGTGTFKPDTALKTSFTPSPADLLSGSVKLYLKAVALPSCVDVNDTSLVSMFDVPDPSAGKDTTICYNSTFTLINDKAPYSKEIRWSTTPIVGDGVFDDNTKLHPTYTFGVNDLKKGFVTLTIKTAGNANCDTVSSSMTVTIDKGPQIEAGRDTTICYNGTHKLSTAVATKYKTLTWTSSGDGTFDDKTKVQPIYTPGLTDLVNKTVKLTLTGDGLSACKTASDFMTLQFYNQLTINVTSGGLHSNSTSCFGAWDADAHITALGGNAPYTYKWSNPKITGKDTLLLGGTFTASVVDTKGCVVSNSIIITEPPKIKTTCKQVDTSKCYLDNNGSALITITSGGVAGFNYLWSNATIVTKATGLTAGKKYVTVTDANLCHTVDSVIIFEPSRVKASFVNVLPSCPGKSDGSITAVASGGTIKTSYVYLWSNGNATNKITALATGTYGITVTDDNLCKYDTTFVLPNPVALSVNVAISNVKCYGDSTGQLIAHAIGGTKPYTFSWATSLPIVNKKDSILAHIPATDGTTDPRVVVKDAHNCSVTSPKQSVTQPAIFSIDVGKPSPFKISATTKITVSFKGKHDMVQDLGFSLLDTKGNTFTLSTSPSKSGSPNPGCNVGRNFDISFSSDSINVLDMCAIHPYLPLGWPAAWTDNNRKDWPENPAITGGFASESPWANLYFQDPSNGGWTLQIDDCFPLKVGEKKDSNIWKSATLSFTDKNVHTGLVETIQYQMQNIANDTTYINQPTAAGCSITKYRIPMKMSTSCYGLCDAEGIMNPQGGVSPYHYKWSSKFIPDNDTLYLCAGVYTVTASDANGCTSKSGVTITQPAKIVAKLDSISNLCFGRNTGKAIASVKSGGVKPFTYLWTGGSTDTVAKNLAGGKYFLSITDDNKCPQVDSIVVRDSLKVLSKIKVDSTLCFGSSEGKIMLSPYGTNIKSPFNYTWIAPPSTLKDTLIGLSAGTYKVTVIDNQGCRLDTSAKVPAPLPITLGGSIIKSPACLSGSDGKITLSIKGGSNPMTFKWKNIPKTVDSTKSTLIGVPAGTYALHISDKNGCSKDTNFIVIDPPGMIPSITATDSVKCNGDATAKAVITVKNGVQKYSFKWSTSRSTPNALTDSIINLKAGKYYVTVTDQVACTINDSVIIKEPKAVTLKDTIIDSVSCNGFADAKIKVSTKGGTKPYSFNWSNAATDSIVSGIKAGTYNVSVSDKYGCKNKSSIVLVEPVKLDFKLTAQKHSECSTKSGMAFVQAKGGTRGYSYTWSPNVGNDSTVTDLFVGTYFITVTDKHKCTINTSIKVTDTTSLAIKTHTIQKSITCKGRNDGSGYVVASGTSNYAYKWSEGTIKDTITKLLNGKYIVTVTDFYTCKRVDTLVIDTSNMLTASMDIIKNVSCYSNNNGSLHVKPLGGSSTATMGCTYLWSNGITAATISSLTIGSYSVTVSDTSNCKVVTTQKITKSVFTASFVNTKDVLCHNTCNGSSIFSADKAIGTKPFKYTWSNGETDSLAKALCAVVQNYVTVTDKMNCTYIDSVTVKDLVTSMTINFDTKITPCGQNFGEAIAHVTGGTKKYSFSWNNGITDSSNISLFADIYDLTVTDGNGCKFKSSVTVSDTTHLPFILTSVDVLACTSCTGNITAIDTLKNDKMAYSYKWTPGNSTSASFDKKTLTNACVGIQTVKVTREDWCSNTFRDSVRQAKGLQIATHILKARNCIYANDGSVYVTYKNNKGPVSYKWSNGSTDTSAINLKSGTYFVTVTDGLCTLSDSITVTDPLYPVPQMSSTTVSCFNGSDGSASIILNDQNGFLLTADSIYWNDSKINPQKTYKASASKAINVPFGKFTASIYYNNSCVIKDSIQVNQNTKLNVSWKITKNPHCNATDGEIVAVGTGGVQFANSNKYKFRWHAVGMDSIKLPQYNNDTINGIGVDYYVLNVQDSLNCPFTSPQILLTDNGDIQILDKITSKPDSVRFPTCGSPLINNGYFRVKPSGSNPPFDYKYWRYNTTITDSAGAWWKLSTKDQIKGTGAADSLPTGNYKVYVSNGVSKNCKSVALFTIGTNYLTAAASKSDVTCPLVPDGKAKVIASNGLPYLHKPNYRYIWNTGSTKDSIVNLKPGNYFVTVTDSISCPVVQAVTISNPVFMSITMPDTVQTLCYSDTAVTVIPKINGGQKPFTFDWDNGKSSADKLISAKVGWHKVTVRDKGCFVANDSILVEKKGFLKLDSVTNPKIYCGKSDGKLIVHASGSSKPLNFAWNNGVTDSINDKLPVGYYSYTVTDAKGCKLSLDTIKLVDTSTVKFKIYKTSDVHCAGKAIGVAYVSDTVGGTKPYPGVRWNNENTLTNVITNKWKADTLRAGIIEVRVFDSQACTGLDRVRIIADSVLKVTFTNKTNDVSCPSSTNYTGSVHVEAANGKEKYTFSWNTSTGSSPQDLSNKAQGKYFVTVTDQNNCLIKDSVTILKAPMVVDSVKQTDATCFGSTDGVLIVKTKTGTGIIGNTLTYNWSNNQQNDTISGLGIGLYTVTITDVNNANACTAMHSFTIIQPQQFVIGYDTLKKTTCKDSLGILVAKVTGGIKPYSYSWTGMVKPDVLSTTDTIHNYWTNFYNFDGKDSRGCPFHDKIQTNDTSLLSLKLDTLSAVSCNKFTNGLMQVKTSKAVKPYSFAWLNSVATTSDSLAQNLKAGTYSVTVFDFNGCKASVTAKVTEPDTLTIAFQKRTKITCNASKDSVVAHIIGGNGGNTLQWKKDLVAIPNVDTIISNATIGTYQITVTDSKNCFAVSSVVMTQAPKIVTYFSTTNTGCGTNFATGTAKIDSIISDYSPSTFKWFDSSSDSLHKFLSKGTYYVTITDAKKCIVSDSVKVLSDNFSDLKIDTVQMAKCNYNSPTGTVKATATGSVKPYIWAWSRSKSDTTDSMIKLLPGIYTVTVTGKTSCTASKTVTVTPMVNIEAAITTNGVNGAVSSINFCKNDSVTLIGSLLKRTIHYNGTLPIRNERFLWGVKDGNTDSLLATMSSDNGDSIKVKPFEPTTYQMWYSIYGCSVPVQEVSLKFYEPIGLKIEIIKDGEVLHDTTTIVKGYRLELKPDKEPWFINQDTSVIGFNSYEWNSYDTLMKANGIVNKKIRDSVYYYNNLKSYSLEVAPTQASWFVVVGTTNKGCHERDSVKIRVSPDFIIPSGITPNGDGVNDTWNLPYLKQFPDARVTIFNRWGILIWEKNKDYNSEPFVGKNKDGKDLPLGTYYYLIEFNDDKGTQPKAGSITIVR